MRVEFYHDILAQKVFDKASAEEKARLKIERFVRERHRYFIENRELLTKKELDYVTPYLDKLELEPVYRDFISRSLEDVRRKRRNRILFLVSGIFILLALLAVALLALYSVSRKNEDLILLNGAVNANSSLVYLEEGNLLKAFETAQMAYQNGDSSARAIAVDVFQELHKSGLYCGLSHQDSIIALDVSPDEKYLLTGSENGEVKIWDESCNLKMSYSHSARLKQAQFFPDSQFSLLLSLHEDSTIIIYDYLQGMEVGKIIGPQGISGICLSPGGQWWGYWNKEKGAKLFSMASPLQEIFSIPFSGPVIAIDFSSSNILLLASRDSVQVFGIGRSSARRLASPFPSPVGKSIHARFLFDNTIFLSGESGQRLVNYKGQKIVGPNALIPVFSRGLQIETLEIREGSPDYLMAYLYEKGKNEVLFARLDPLFEQVILIGFDVPVSYLCLSKKGGLSLIAAENGRFEVRSTKDGAMKYRIRGVVNKARFFGEDKFLATCAENTAYIWHLPESVEAARSGDPNDINNRLDTMLFR